MSNKLQVINKLTGRVMYAGYDSRSARVAAGGDWAMIILRDGLICDKRTCKPSLRTLKDAAERAARAQEATARAAALEAGVPYTLLDTGKVICGGVIRTQEGFAAEPAPVRAFRLTTGQLMAVVAAPADAMDDRIPFSWIECRAVQTGYVDMTQEVFAALSSAWARSAAIAVQAAGAVFTANRDRVPFTQLSTRRVHVGPDQFAQSVFAYLQDGIASVRVHVAAARYWRQQAQRCQLATMAVRFFSHANASMQRARQMRDAVQHEFGMLR